MDSMDAVGNLGAFSASFSHSGANFWQWLHLRNSDKRMQANQSGGSGFAIDAGVSYGKYMEIPT